MHLHALAAAAILAASHAAAAQRTQDASWDARHHTFSDAICSEIEQWANERIAQSKNHKAACTRNRRSGVLCEMDHSDCKQKVEEELPGTNTEFDEDVWESKEIDHLRQQVKRTITRAVPANDFKSKRGLSNVLKLWTTSRPSMFIDRRVNRNTDSGESGDR